MSLETWNWKHPVELQDVPWDCAAASLTWALNAAGYPLSESEVVSGLGPGRISPQYGLLDASGAGLVEYLAELGITADNMNPVTWQDVHNLAGHNPMVMGGRGWNHWTGVRAAGDIVGRPDIDQVLLANPAPGWMEVYQYIAGWQFDALGSFSAVWFAHW
jgi:hypothetical protein